MTVPPLLQRCLDAFQTACTDGEARRAMLWMTLDTPSYLALQTDARAYVRLRPLTQPLAELPTLSSPHGAPHARKFTTFVHEYLAYVRDDPPPSDPHADAATYSAWAKVYASLNAVFMLPDTVWIVPLLKFVAKQLVALAIRIDAAASAPTYTHTIDAAGRLSKSAGLAANDRTAHPCAQTKRVAVLTLANLSFRAYFRLHNTRLCETVLGSVHNAMLMNRKHGQPVDPTGEAQYTMAERVTYHYYLGQIRLLQHRVSAAREHLQWAWDHCHTAHAANQRRILSLLVPANMILGRYATPAVLRAHHLDSHYGAILHALRQGHASQVYAELERHRRWLRARGLYLLLREKLELTLWRNLFQRCMRHIQARATASQAPPTLPLASLVRPARLAFNDADLSLDDLECMAANLIDQGLMKAYILHSKRVIVLQRGPHRGFPPVADVFPT